MLRPFVFVLCGLAWTSATFGASDPASPWTVAFTPRDGATISYAGIPIVRRSTLKVARPGWKKELYRTTAPKVSRTTSEAGPSLTVLDDQKYVRARYQLDALDARRFRLRFEATLLKDVPAEIEYAIGYFNANLIANRPYRGTTTAGPIEGTVPAHAGSSSEQIPVLARDIRTLSFDSRIGGLRIEVCENSVRPAFLDARQASLRWTKVRGQWRTEIDLRKNGRNAPLPWAHVEPTFWWGLPARPIRASEPVQVEVIIHIVPALKATQPRQIAPPLIPAQRVTFPPAPSIEIVPQPKSAQFEEGMFVLADRAPWSLTQPEGETRLAAALLSILEGRCGLVLGEGRTHSHGSDWTVLRIGPVALEDSPPSVASTTDSAWGKTPEAYRLTVRAAGITITAPSPRGAFYGLQTLAQMLGSVDGGIGCRQAMIEDWPALAFRGAHWHTSASGVPMHRRIIERVMAGHKMNYAVIQCDRARWDSHPEIASPNAISKSDLRELVELCRANFIEPIPLINGPGHGQWMFNNGQNLDIAEDPANPYAYAINNPRSYEFIEAILAEALEVFEPDYFHLGHDEIANKGRFPNPDSPYYRGETVMELYLKNLRRLNDWLDERGVQAMIWGDMLLSEEEMGRTNGAHAPNTPAARAARAQVPKDVIIADWHYWRDGDDYPSLSLFHKEGLRTLASTFFRPENVYYFTHAAARADSWGLLQTTWGFFPDERRTLRDPLRLRHYAVFPLAADYAWSLRKTQPRELPYDWVERFMKSYRDDGLAPRPGVLVDLTDAAATPRADWLALVADRDLPSPPEGIDRYSGVLFKVPAEGLPVIGAAMAPRGAVRQLTMSIDASASELAILNASAWESSLHDVPVRMIVQYADGIEKGFDFEMGHATAAWTDREPILLASIGWEAQSPEGVSAALRVTRWRNPRPDQPIARLIFETVNPEHAWCLAGLTLLQ